GRHLQRRHRRTVAIRGLERDHTLSATPVLWEIIERRELAVAVLGRRENVALADDDEADDLMPFAELDATNTRGLAPHRAHFALVEANRLATARHEDDLLRALGQADADELVVLGEIERDDARRARPRERRERRLLHRALARGHEHEVLLVV